MVNSQHVPEDHRQIQRVVCVSICDGWSYPFLVAFDSIGSLVYKIFFAKRLRKREQKRYYNMALYML